MTIFLNDTFTDTAGTLVTAHTAETGQTWTAINPYLQATVAPRSVTATITAAGQARATAAGDAGSSHAIFIAPTSTFSDYTVTGDFVWTSAPNDYVGLGARASAAAGSANARGYWLLMDDSDLELYVMNGSGSASRLTTLGYPLPTGDTYRATISVLKSTIMARIQRVSDDQWLTSGGVWQAGQTSFASTTNTLWSDPGAPAFDVRGDATSGVGLDQIVADGVVGFLSTPSAALASQTNLVLTLVGSGTTWDGSTTFTLSGLTGTSKVSQTVTDATHATVTINTGATLGNATLSDGTITTLIEVGSGSAPAPGAVFLTDTFTDTAGTTLPAHTSDSGHTWTAISPYNQASIVPRTSTAVITAGGQARASAVGVAGSSHAVFIAGVSPISPDYTVTADFVWTGAPNDFVGLGIRASAAPSSANACGYWLLMNASQIQLYAMNNAGSAGALGTSVNVALTVGGTYRVSVLAYGSAISARIQRLSDNMWLTSLGNWQGPYAVCAAVTDTTWTSTGSPAFDIRGDSSAAGVGLDQITADGTIGFVSAPAIVPSNQTNVVLTLSGAGTAWTGGTAFTLSGVAGVTKVSQSVAGSTSATVTISTGATAGDLTINDGAGHTTTVEIGGLSLPVTSTALAWSPYNWYSNGAGAMQANNVRATSTFVWSQHPGAYTRILVTSAGAGKVILNVDGANLTGVVAGNGPTIAWSVDGAAMQLQPITVDTITVTLADNLAAGVHTIFLWFRSFSILNQGDRWNGSPPQAALKITGFTLGSGMTAVDAPVTRPKRAVIWGDSITEGDLTLGLPRGTTSMDGLTTWGALVAPSLDCEFGIVGFFGQRWGWLSTTWSSYSSGVTKLINGKLSPEPDFILINYGENDNGNAGVTALATSTLASIAAAAPNAKIFVNIPFSGRSRSVIKAAALPPRTTIIDVGLDTTGEMKTLRYVWTADGQHPVASPGNANLATRVIAKILRVVYGSGYGSSI